MTGRLVPLRYRESHETYLRNAERKGFFWTIVRSIRTYLGVLIMGTLNNGLNLMSVRSEMQDVARGAGRFSSQLGSTS